MGLGLAGNPMAVLIGKVDAWLKNMDPVKLS